MMPKSRRMACEYVCACSGWMWLELYLMSLALVSMYSNAISSAGEMKAKDAPGPAPNSRVSHSFILTGAGGYWSVKVQRSLLHTTYDRVWALVGFVRILNL